MPAYEAMFIFRPQLKEEEQKSLLNDLEKILKENQAKVENMQLFGRRQLAYEISKCKEGLYYLVNFSTSSREVVSRLRKASNINENILRVMVIKKTKR